MIDPVEWIKLYEELKNTSRNDPRYFEIKRLLNSTYGSLHTPKETMTMLKYLLKKLDMLFDWFAIGVGIALGVHATFIAIVWFGS